MQLAHPWLYRDAPSAAGPPNFRRSTPYPGAAQRPLQNSTPLPSKANRSKSPKKCHGHDRDRIMYVIKTTVACAYMSRHRSLLGVAAVIASAMLIVVQAGQLAGTWDYMPRVSGQITYAVDRELGKAAIDGARDAFAAWDAANDDIVLVESETWAAADVRVARMDVFCAAGKIVNGCACLSMSPGCPFVDNMLRGHGCPVPAGATVGVAPGMYDKGGTLKPHTRGEMRDLVAHEFGHNLGLEHNGKNLSHLMHGQPGVAAYSDRGYAVPEPIAKGGMTPKIPANDWNAPESCVSP